MNKQKKNSSNGITLIALIITIIVLLILSGVSINAMIGENGVLTKAQNATMIQSCAVLEEFLQQYYVSNFDELPQDTTNKAEALQSYKESKLWIYNPMTYGYGNLNYIVNADGNICYFINKSKLPDDVKKNIKGGDAGKGTYFDYVTMNDVYGVTSDLKVYYCSNGKDSMLAMDANNLENEDPERTVFDSNIETSSSIYSLLSKFDSNGDGVLSVQETKSIHTLTIDGTDNITSLKDLGNLNNLKNLTLNNVRLESLEGISGVALLEKLVINNSVIGNYDDLAENQNLQSLLCLFNDNNVNADEEVRKICGNNGDGHIGISQAILPKLTELGFYGSWGKDGNTLTVDSYKSNLTDITSIENLNENTKANIKKLYIQNNRLQTINCLSGFNNLEYINVGFNDLIDFKGIENAVKLNTLSAYENNNLGQNDKDGVDNKDNALYYIAQCKDIVSINIDGNSKIQYFSYIKELSKLDRLSLYSSNLNTDDLILTKDFLKGLSYCNLNNKYSILLLDDNSTEISLNSETIEKSIFLGLSDYQSLEVLNFDHLKIVDSSGNVLPAVELNQVINEMLSKLKKLRRADLCGIGLSSLDFIYDASTDTVNTPKLTALNLVDNAVTDLSNLEKCPIKGLGINNANIDLTKIQKTISNCREGNGICHGYSGLYIGNGTLLKKLEDCTEVTNIRISDSNWRRNDSSVTLDLSRLTKLKTIYLSQRNVKMILPSNLEELTIIDAEQYPSLTNCTNLKYLCYSKGGIYDRYSTSNALESLQSKVLSDTLFSQVYISGISGLENLSSIANNYRTSNLTINSCNDFVTTTGIGSMIDLKTLILTNNSSLNDLTELSILSSLETLNLSNCAISNLYEISNLSKLNYINLENNSLSNTYSMSGIIVKNLEIISQIKDRNNNLKVYLKGNSGIVDWSQLEKYSGWWHDNEKAGY